MRIKHTRFLIPVVFLFALLTILRDISAQADVPTRPLRIIAFGAHPDDCEFRIGGCAAKWAKLGHKVKLVSVTNGDVGHWQSAGGPLAQRRLAEVKEAARRLGVEVDVLDNHDGELMPSLENRKAITKLIREWQADMVFSHRPWDYHPDHRYSAILVQDAAFMVTVPYFCPEVPALKANPMFFYFTDKFTKPYPFHADIAVSIDDVFDIKLEALDALASQVYEGGASGSAKPLPDPIPLKIQSPISRHCGQGSRAKRDKWKWRRKNAVCIKFLGKSCKKSWTWINFRINDSHHS